MRIVINLHWEREELSLTTVQHPTCAQTMTGLRRRPWNECWIPSGSRQGESSPMPFHWDSAVHSEPSGTGGGMGSGAESANESE